MDLAITSMEACAAQEIPPQVVIVGGGFGGLSAAKELAGKELCVTLIDRANHHLFQPLLYQVATALILIRGDKSRSFRHFDKGSMATIGRNKAIADLKFTRFGGFSWLFSAESEQTDLSQREVS